MCSLCRIGRFSRTWSFKTRNVRSYISYHLLHNKLSQKSVAKSNGYWVILVPKGHRPRNDWLIQTQAFSWFYIHVSRLQSSGLLTDKGFVWRCLTYVLLNLSTLFHGLARDSLEQMTTIERDAQVTSLSNHKRAVLSHVLLIKPWTLEQYGRQQLWRRPDKCGQGPGSGQGHLWEGRGHCVNFLIAVTKCLTSATSGRKSCFGSQFEGVVPQKEWR